MLLEIHTKETRRALDLFYFIYLKQMSQNMLLLTFPKMSQINSFMWNQLINHVNNMPHHGL